MIEVTFRSLNRSAHVWSASFDLGDEMENGLYALDVAFKHNAEIIASTSAKGAVT